MNRLWSLIGVIIPTSVAILIVPGLIARLGVDRFGVLSLCWMLVGYASLLDMGLGRALTKRIAEFSSLGDMDECRAYLRSALVGLLCLGLLTGAVVIGASHKIAEAIADSNVSLGAEIGHAMVLMGLTLPFVVGSAAFSGALEGTQSFRVLNQVRAICGTLTLIIPYMASCFTARLELVTVGVLLGRIVMFFALGNATAKIIPRWIHGLRIDKQRLKDMFTYGRWLTVSGIISPFMEYSDRFAVSVALGAGAVAFYTLPYDVLVKFWILPIALTAVAFPEIVVATMTRKSARRILRITFNASLVVVAPLCFAVILLSADLLELWVGSIFAVESADIAKILAIGVLINTAARIPHVYLLAVGRADWVAKLHVAELGCYVGALWLALEERSLSLVALVWTLRIVVDTAALYALSGYHTPDLRREFSHQAIVVAGLVSVAVMCISAPLSHDAKLIFGGIFIVAAGIGGLTQLMKMIRSPSTEVFSSLSIPRK